MMWIWIVIGMLLLTVLVLFVMARLLMSRVLRAGARLAIHAAWAKVSSHPHGTLKVVEADKILDEALRLLGYTGTLGEKLKKAGPRFSDLDAVWKAHKLRNKLVHQLDAAPRDAEVERAVESFRRALNDLGAGL
jgi:hypothetical protein